jgi:hypothetical protein
VHHRPTRRSSFWFRWLRVVAWLGAQLLASAARGQTTLPLRYRAPDGCPDRDAFVKGLTARLQAQSPSISRIAVTITNDPEGHRARVVLLERSGAVSSRELVASSCAEAAAAAAVSIAILLDALSDQTPSMPSQAEPAVSALPAHSADAARGMGWRAGLGLGVIGASGLTPHLLAAPGVVIGLVAPSHGALTPEVDLSASYADSGALHVQNQTARIYWAFGRLDVCPLEWRASFWALRPCAVVEAGVVTGTALDPLVSKRVVRPWLAPGAILRWQAEVFGPGFLRAEVGAVAPMWTYQFRFGPSAVIDRVATFGLRLEIVLGMHFP